MSATTFFCIAGVLAFVAMSEAYIGRPEAKDVLATPTVNYVGHTAASIHERIEEDRQDGYRVSFQMNAAKRDAQIEAFLAIFKKEPKPEFDLVDLKITNELFEVTRSVAETLKSTPPMDSLIIDFKVPNVTLKCFTNTNPKEPEPYPDKNCHDIEFSDVVVTLQAQWNSQNVPSVEKAKILNVQYGGISQGKAFDHIWPDAQDSMLRFTKEAILRRMKKVYEIPEPYEQFFPALAQKILRD